MRICNESIEIRIHIWFVFGFKQICAAFVMTLFGVVCRMTSLKMIPKGWILSQTSLQQFFESFLKTFKLAQFPYKVANSRITVKHTQCKLITNYMLVPAELSTS